MPHSVGARRGGKPSRIARQTERESVLQSGETIWWSEISQGMYCSSLRRQSHSAMPSRTAGGNVHWQFRSGQPYRPRCAACVSRPDDGRPQAPGMDYQPRSNRGGDPAHPRFLRGRPGFRWLLASVMTSDSSITQVLPTLLAFNKPCVIMAATRRALTPSLLAASVVPINAILGLIGISHRETQFRLQKLFM